MSDLQKKYITVQLTEEQVFYSFAMRDPEYGRRGSYVPREVPADEQARYEAALAGYKALEAYEGTEWGYENDLTVTPPSTTTWEFTETDEEWLARCRKRYEEHGEPASLWQRFSIPKDTD